MHYKPNKQSGFTLIEVLMTMLIQAFAVLASLTNQATRAGNKQRAHYRSKSTSFANDMQGNMRPTFARVTPPTSIFQDSTFKKTNVRCKTILSSGFTLVELMVTVAIVGIVTSLGVPSFLEMMNQNRASSLANELAASLNLARSEAIKRGTQVTVCKSANITAASPTCSTTANWRDGWLIFVDGSTSGTFDGTDARLKVGQPSNSNAVIAADTTFTNYISYLSSGMSKGSGLPNGSLDICVSGIQRSIIINTTGRIRFSKGTC